MSAGGKTRLIEIIKILIRETDADNQISTTELTNRLAGIGYEVNRKTLKDDLDALVNGDIGITMIKSSPNKYYWAGSAVVKRRD